MNGRMRGALVLGEKAEVGKKRSATHGTYIGYTPEERAKIMKYAADNRPDRATRHFAMPEITQKLESSILNTCRNLRQCCTILKTRPLQ